MPATAVPPAKPTYLGLVNAIAVAEGHGYRAFTEWADRSADPDVEAVLRMVAAREGEHSSTFARRVVELGYRVRPRPPSKEEEHRPRWRAPTAPIFEKLLALGYGSEPGDTNLFDGYFTGSLHRPGDRRPPRPVHLRERDSARMLRQACVRLQS